MTRTLRDARGVTLVELMVALLIAGLVLTAALSFFRQQGDALSRGTEQATVLQNYRYAIATLRRDLRTAGSGVLDQQPFLVFAGPNAVAFNADYASDDAANIFAVYVDTTAPAATVEALTPGGAITIPGSTFSYPGTAYTEQGTNSPAETIVFSFEADATTPRADDFVLLRRVNGTPPATVARNLLRTPGKPFFEYLRIVDPGNAPARVETVPAASLPLRHSVAVHGSAADAGAAALIDGIRAVRVNLSATNGRTGAREQIRSTTRLVRLPNAGLANLKTCGETPQLGVSLAAAQGISATGRPVVTLAWGRAADESGGERDAVRYVIWRRSGVGAPWGDPFISVPSGQPAYSYVDESVETDSVYQYALAVQDCTPALSSLAGTGAIGPIP